MSEHQTELLGAYAIGVLAGDELATVRTHVSGCDFCQRELDDLREMEAALGEIPPEAFLDGPPRDGDLLLHRTLRQVRTERNRDDRRRRLLISAAAVIAAFAVLAGGALVGRITAPAAPAVATAAPGATVTDPDSGVSMSAAVQPAAGWVRVRATVSGAPPGEQCRLYVVSRDGSRREAGSWLVPDGGSTTLDGSALTAPDDVISIDVETFAGRPLVSVPV
jgi:anti-sigma factor RsiW